MNASSKSSKKVAFKKSKNKKGSSPKTQNNRIPNEGIITIGKIRFDYSSMRKAIQQIANPVSFKFLKQFYNIDQ